MRMVRSGGLMMGGTVQTNVCMTNIRSGRPETVKVDTMRGKVPHIPSEYLQLGTLATIKDFFGLGKLETRDGRAWLEGEEIDNEKLAALATGKDEAVTL